MSDELPAYTDLPVREGAPPHSSWGVWADRDALGCLNLLTPERTLAAARSIRSGTSFGLSPELTLPHPPLFGRRPFRHDVEPMGSGGAQDDVLHDFNTQSSAQWDGFRHFPHREHGFYGGLADEEHGVHHWAGAGIVGRGVLVDIDRWRRRIGRPLRQGESDPIPTEDLDACLATQGSTLEVGDILLVRTGWLSWYRGLDDAAREACASNGASPGLAGTDMPGWLWDHHLSAVVADNPAVEAIPADPDRGFLHPHVLPLLGMPLGEMWDLDALAAACADDGVYDCFLASAPLNLPGGVASPPNAVAVR